MDFPIFHLDFIGNRLLIAITAVIHVIINHPMAVGAVPLVALLEWIAYKRNDPALDRLAYKFTFVFFVITTSLGALTGVGIWFTTSLVNPDAIGSLIRVFFWVWFTEWMIFVIEVSLIMLYFLTWKKMTGERKKNHIRIGAFLAFFSWLTLAFITGILGFMMNSGKWVPYVREWTAQSDMWTAFFNPLYWPQLAFRTPFALMTAGLFFLFLVPFFTHKGAEIRGTVVRRLSLWVLLWLPLTAVAAHWYWRSIPGFMAANAPVAVATQNYVDWYQTILIAIAVMVITVFVVAWLGVARPRWLPRVLLLLPFIISIALIGLFERVREFVRKPYVIADYMYSNGLRERDYSLFKQDGILSHAAYVRHHSVTEANKIQAGRDVFMLTCSRCHTLGGVNSVLKNFDNLFPNTVWQEEQIGAYIENMHNIRIFMPPFPGNEAERDALAAFICNQQNRTLRIDGAQSAGVMP